MFFPKYGKDTSEIHILIFSNIVSNFTAKLSKNIFFKFHLNKATESIAGPTLQATEVLPSVIKLMKHVPKPFVLGLAIIFLALLD